MVNIQLGRLELRGALLVIVLLTFASSAQAQTADEPQVVTVDASQGPVTGSTRVIGLGGAYVAIADGVDGVAKNPATVAVRVPYSWTEWGYGFGIDFAIGAWLPTNDVLNQGEGAAELEQRSTLFGSLGATLHYEHAGLGVSAEGQRQALTGTSQAEAGLAPIDLSGNFGIVHASIGYAFIDGQLALGIGPRLTGLSFSGSSSGSDLLNVAGIGLQGGVVYKPRSYPIRIGAAAKTPVNPSVGQESATAESGVWTAKAVTLPWLLSLGVAYQLGPRPMNLPLVTIRQRTQNIRREVQQNERRRDLLLSRAERIYELHPSAENARELAAVRARAAKQEQADERRLAQAEQLADQQLKEHYLALPRHYWLITTELTMLGPSSDSIGFDSFWSGSGSVGNYGRNIAFSPRLGVETEAIPQRLKLRAGTYLEPARSAEAIDRVHATLGFDVKLFNWDAFGLIGDFDGWTLSVALDGAREYLNTGFSIGFWH